MDDIDIDDILIEVDWPILGRLKDDLYPYNGYDHVRYTARALCENEEGYYGFLHIVGEDFFGKRDHLETIGGGLEANETIDETMIRELKEEAGYELIGMKLLGSVLDTYNLINRITFSTFFHCLVDTKNTQSVHRTYEEEVLIKEIVWLDPLDALYQLEFQAESRVDKLVQRRDALVLRYYLENFTELLK